MGDPLAWRAVVAVVVSLAAAGLIGLSSRRPALRELWTIAAALIKVWLIASLGPAVLRGESVAVELWSLAPGLTLALRVDALGWIFALVASVLWLLTSWYSVGYVRSLKLHAQTRYFAAFALCLSATTGIAFAGNLLTFLIFYEVLTVATYPLVVHTGTREARRAGRMYLAYTLSGGAVLMLAVGWTFLYAGRLDFVPGGLLAGLPPSRELAGLFVVFAIAFSVKSALIPLHGWLPRAMVAPTPVSALLHAVAVVKAGVFGYLRLFHDVFGPSLIRQLGVQQPLLWAAGGTILIASLIAMTQDQLKRRLAYSTVSHLSYIILGAALLSPAGMLGSVLHLTNHALMKITLFFCAGSIYVTTHRERVSELTGLGWRMPWTFGAFAVAALGLSGLPTLCGFVSKWWLCRGGLDTPGAWALWILLLSGLLNLAYLLPIVVQGFRGRAQHPHDVREAPLAMTLPLLVTALLVVLLGSAPALITGQVLIAEQVVHPLLGAP